MFLGAIKKAILIMQDKLTVSIITASLNQKDFIEFNIRSVICQDYPFLEHIVIDGCSTDGTLDILKKYGDCIKWLSEPDRGQSDALNKGFKMATGDIIGWINSDDALAPNALEYISKFFLANSDAKIVGGDLLIIDENNSPLELKKGKKLDFNYLLNNHDGVLQPSTFFKKDLLDTVGFLDESLHYCMDFDLFLRFARIVNFEYIPQVLSMFRKQSASKSFNKVESFCKEAMLVRKRHGGRFFSLYGLRLFIYYYIVWPLMRVPGFKWFGNRVMEARRDKRQESMKNV